MKRIVNCPQCEVKLSIFDTGKPINQKCPKCGHSFVIESEEKKGTDSKEAVATDAKKSQEGKGADEPAIGLSKKGAADKDGTVVAVEATAKDIKLATDLSDTTKANMNDNKPGAVLDELAGVHEPPAGVTFLFKAAVVGLLLLIAIMQVVIKRSADKQYGKIIEHFQYIEKNLIR